MENFYYLIREAFGLYGPNEFSQLSMIGIYLPITIASIIYAYRKLVNKLKSFSYFNEEDLQYFKSLAKYQMAIMLLFGVVWIPYPLETILLAPFSVLASVLPLLAIIRFLKKKYSNGIEVDFLKIKTQDELNDSVESILNSENFLTALRSTLPKGDKDEEYGLDYIPYMLKNVEERRERFSSRGRAFLITTVLTGILFAGVTVWLGYVILDEDSIGSGKTLRSIEDQTRNLTSTLSYLTPDKLQQIEGYRAITNYIDSIKSMLNDTKGLEQRAEILDLFLNFNSSRSLKELQQGLELVNVDYESSTDKQAQVFDLISSLEWKVSQFIRLQDSAISEIPNAIERINNSLELANIEIKKETNRTPDIIKRLVLSIVLISFFLALLRFLATQYKSNFDQLVQAENDDLQIRKSYIALKTAKSGDVESTKMALAFILSKVDTPACNQDSRDSKELSVIKDIINTLAKKL